MNDNATIYYYAIGSGSRTPIAITILVRKGTKK